MQLHKTTADPLGANTIRLSFSYAVGMVRFQGVWRAKANSMEMHQIRYFLAVCQELNFTRAAETCHVAQPSLTRAIKLLEEELGGLLLVREAMRTPWMGKESLAVQRARDESDDAAPARPARDVRPA